MAETQGEVRVRNVSTRRTDSLVESATEFAGGVFRLGFSLVTLPLAVLPHESRTHMRNATREMFHAFATLPRNFAEIAGEAVDEWAKAGDEPAHAPRDEMKSA